MLVRMDGDSEDDYPDALEFIDVFNGRLVKLPRTAISRQWSESVYGLWNGIVVSLSVISGVDDHYRAGSVDPAAGALGFQGDQYQSWRGVIPAKEVLLLKVKITERPVTIPFANMSSDDMIASKVNLLFPEE